MYNETRWLDRDFDGFPRYTDDSFESDDERYQFGEFSRKYGIVSAVSERWKGWKAREYSSEISDVP